MRISNKVIIASTVLLIVATLFLARNYIFSLGESFSSYTPEKKPVVIEEPKEEPKQSPKKKVKTRNQVPSSLAGVSSEDLEAWYAKRYGLGKNLKPFVITEYKGGVVNRKDLEKTIRAVFQRLPNMRTNSHSIALLLETAEVETLRGKLVENKLSSATGIFQILPRTAKDTLKWLSANHKDIHTSLMELYNRKLSLRDNLYHNIPFAIGLAATYYWRMNPYLWENISTTAERAFIWKISYNTYYDRHGSAEGYLKTVAYCESRNL